MRTFKRFSSQALGVPGSFDPGSLGKTRIIEPTEQARFGSLLAVILALLMPESSRSGESPVFHLADSQIHHRFSSAIAPAISVPSGATIVADVRDSADGQIDPSSELDGLRALDMGRVHPLTGRVFVKGAEPGETLAVTLLRIEPGIGEGTRLYFPVFVAGALFSIGDGYAVQGRGEVIGPAVEISMRVTFRVELINGRAPVTEPQYENDTFYAVASSGPSLDQAAKKAVGYMVDYLVAYHGLSPEDAYFLCTLAADLMINELPNKPNVSMTMRIRKEVLGIQ